MSVKPWSKLVLMIAIATLIVFILTITFYKNYYSISQFSLLPVIMPFVIGGSIAFFLNFLLKFYELKIKKRAISLPLVYLTVFAVLTGFILFLAPQVAETMTHFIEEFPDYSEQIINSTKDQLGRFDLTDDHVETVGTSMEEAIERFVNFNSNLLPSLMEKITIIGQTLTNVALGFVLSIYLLAKKEMLNRQFGQLFLLILGARKRDVFFKWLKVAHSIFANFFAGMALNSLIIGIITGVTLFIFRIPFAILIAFIVAMTNIIPIFGPFIGAVPSAIMIFFISPTKAILFVVLILVIQQIDANIITPKIVGKKIGIAPFWVLVSILVYGKFFGLVGLILGVPLTALVMEILKSIIRTKCDKTPHKNTILKT